MIRRPGHLSASQSNLERVRNAALRSAAVVKPSRSTSEFMDSLQWKISLGKILSPRLPEEN